MLHLDKFKHFDILVGSSSPEGCFKKDFLLLRAIDFEAQSS